MSRASGIVWVDPDVCKITLIAVLAACAFAASTAVGPPGAIAEEADELQVENEASGELQKINGSREKTLRNLVAALTRNIESGTLSDSGMNEALERRCIANLLYRHYDAARLDCDQVLASEPTRGPALVTRAELKLRSADFSSALTDLNMAIAKSELDEGLAGYAYLLRGVVYGALNQFDRALPDLERAVALDPRLRDWLDRINREVRSGKRDHSVLDDIQEALGAGTVEE